MPDFGCCFLGEFFSFDSQVQQILTGSIIIGHRLPPQIKKLFEGKIKKWKIRAMQC